MTMEEGINTACGCSGRGGRRIQRPGKARHNYTSKEMPARARRRYFITFAACRHAGAGQLLISPGNYVPPPGVLALQRLAPGGQDSLSLSRLLSCSLIVSLPLSLSIYLSLSLFLSVCLSFHSLSLSVCFVLFSVVSACLSVCLYFHVRFSYQFSF